VGASFDLVVTDPPYGETNLAWDTSPTAWPHLVAGHTNSMWSFGSMRMFLDHWADFAGWRLSQDVVCGTRAARPVPRSTGSAGCTSMSLHFYRGSWRDLYHQAPRLQ
jgi:site-specific DNA-methyltransferase (adenine-specific)